MDSCNNAVNLSLRKMLLVIIRKLANEKYKNDGGDHAYLSAKILFVLNFFGMHFCEMQGFIRLRAQIYNNSNDSDL